VALNAVSDSILQNWNPGGDYNDDGNDVPKSREK
jgi:hypothetical protein